MKSLLSQQKHGKINIRYFVTYVTVPKFKISQLQGYQGSQVKSSFNLICLRYHLVEFGYGKWLIIPFWYTSALNQAVFVSSLVFWLDYVSPKHEPWLAQTRPIFTENDTTS